MVVRGGYMMIAEIAAAVAGGQQLAPYAALPLQQQDAVAVFSRRQGRQHPGGTAADDTYIHDSASNRRRVR